MKLEHLVLLVVLAVSAWGLVLHYGWIAALIIYGLIGLFGYLSTKRTNPRRVK